MGQRVGVLLVGHGSTTRAAPHALLRRHADAIARSGGFAEVGVAALRGGTPVGEALSGFRCHTVYVVPLLMSAGRLVEVDLSEALAKAVSPSPAGRAVRLCPPLGLHPAVANLIAGRAADALRRRGVALRQATVLIVGHGSQSDPASRQATELQAARVGASGQFRRAAAAFLEEPPGIDETVASLPGPAVAIGFFFAGGAHAREDVPRLLAACAGADVDYLGPIGEDPGIARVAIAIVREAAGGEDAAAQPSSG
jgi:sirohydrochlorin ferrochelatase